MVDKMRHLDLLLQLQGEMFQNMLEEVVSFLSWIRGFVWVHFTYGLWDSIFVKLLLYLSILFPEVAQNEH